jgi:hypothetical protein
MKSAFFVPMSNRKRFIYAMQHFTQNSFVDSAWIACGSIVDNAKRTGEPYKISFVDIVDNVY